MRVLKALPLLAPVLIAACAMGPATPSEVALDPDLLTVRMSDGSLCSGPAPGGVAGAGWSGSLQGCPWNYDYTVAIDSRANPVRFVLQEVFTALGADGLLSPIAVVTITGADGRARVFETPERLGQD